MLPPRSNRPSRVYSATLVSTPPAARTRTRPRGSTPLAPLPGWVITVAGFGLGFGGAVLVLVVVAELVVGATLLVGSTSMSVDGVAAVESGP